MSDGSSGASTAAGMMPSFPAGASFTYPNQAPAESSLYGGINALQQNMFYPQPGQQSLLTPSTMQLDQMLSAQLPQIATTYAAFQPGLSPHINDQLIYGANDPNAVYTPPPPPPPPMPMAPPAAPAQQTSNIQSAITPNEAQGYMGTYSPGSMGGLAGMGQLDPSFLNLATGVNWQNPTNDQMLAWSMMHDPGGMKQTFQGDSAFTTPSSVGDALNPGQQGILNAIALQPGYQGSASAYGGPIGGNNPPSLAGGPVQPSGNAAQAIAGLVGGAGGYGGGTGTPGTSGTLPAYNTGQLPPGTMAGATPASRTAAGQFAGGGIANPAADAFAQFAPYLASQGLNMGPQAEALGATILGQIGLGGPGSTVQSQLYNRLQQQVQDQTRASYAARGIVDTPMGAAGEAQAMSQFNQDWQNQLLQRTIQGATAAQNIDQQGLSTEADMMRQLQAGAMGATAPTQQVIGDYLAYAGAANAANATAIQGYNAQVQAALGMGNLAQQGSQQSAQQLGSLGSGLGSIVGMGLGKG
jgi:hypothetical protein